jgi:hypothetical protein
MLNKQMMPIESTEYRFNDLPFISTMQDFGIIVACCKKDYHLTKACCASIKDFLGDIPICLIVDQNFSVWELEKAYGVQVINKANVAHPFLRDNSFGPFTKMIAFWESPWKHFLYVDSDTIVWGNLLKYLNYFKYFDVIISRPCRRGYSRQEICYFFFDIEAIEKHFPSFNWQQHQNNYFCAGVFFGTRNIFTLEEYKKMLEFMAQNPNVMKMGDQGCLNFLIFRAADEGRIQLKQEQESIIQLTIPNFKNNEVLAKRFPIGSNGPIYQNEDTVIHWCGEKKPDLYNQKVYSEPVNYYRRKFLEDAWGYKGLGAEIVLKLEDFQQEVYKNYTYYKNKLAKAYHKKFIPWFNRYKKRSE